MRLPSLRTSAAVHPENGHGPEAPTAFLPGQRDPPSSPECVRRSDDVPSGVTESVPHGGSEETPHAGGDESEPFCKEALTSAESSMPLQADAAGVSAPEADAAGLSSSEAFDDLLQRLQAAYLRDLAQLPALSEENVLLRQQLVKVKNLGTEMQNGHAERPLATEPEAAAKTEVQVVQSSNLDAKNVSLPGLSEELDVTNDKPFEECGSAAHSHNRHRLTIAQTLKFTTFYLQEVWNEQKISTSTISMPASKFLEKRATSAWPAQDEGSEGEGAIQRYDGCIGQCISPPGSPLRMIWDFAGATFIFYDLFSIPLQVFDIKDSPYVVFSATMDWITLLFWTTNVIASLTVGYVDRGLIVMEPLKILRNYFKGWFWVDLVVVVPDWAFTIAASDDGGKSDAGSSVKLLRILRLVRMVRLVRLLKLRKIMQDVNDHIDSEYISIIASIIKMILVLLAINHFIACAWYGIAAAYQGDSQAVTWIKAHNFEGDTWYYMYATAFHWSITQFTPSSMQVQPHNMLERSFAVAIVVFALVGFSYLVGGIISHIGQLRSMGEDSAKQFWNLRRYLRQNCVPIELSIRIQRYLEHAWQRKQATLQAADIQVFSMLSDQLHSELKCALALPHLFVHPLFQTLEKVSYVTNQRLAHTAIDHTLLAIDDNLFLPGEMAHYLYVVVKGRLQYFRFDSEGAEHKEWVDKAEDWIAEPVLWVTAWHHLGLLCACKECDLLTLDATKWVEAVKRNPQASQFLSHYAHNFIAWINEQNRDALSDISQGEVVSPLVNLCMYRKFDHETRKFLDCEDMNRYSLDIGLESLDSAMEQWAESLAQQKQNPLPPSSPPPSSQLALQMVPDAPSGEPTVMTLHPHNGQPACATHDEQADQLMLLQSFNSR